MSKPEEWVELRTDTDTGIETIRAHFKGHAYDPHWHDSYLIGVTEQGMHQFSCRKQRHTCIPGSTFLLEPGEIHDGDTEHLEGFTYRMLYLPPDWLEQTLSELFENRPDNFELTIASTLADDRRLTLAVSHAFLALHLKEGRLLKEGALDQMLELMTCHLNWRKKDIIQADNHLALKTREYLAGHLYKDISVSDTADALGCDRFRLTRSFKQYYGISPHAWLAWQLYHASMEIQSAGSDVPAGWRTGAVLQFINPKTWMMAIAVSSVYMGVSSDWQYTSLLAFIFLLIAIPCLFCWALLGRGASRWLNKQKQQTWFTRFLAILLLASVWWSVWLDLN